MGLRSQKIPTPVLKRMALYLQHVRDLRERDQEWVSSHELAASLGLGSSSVRQDLTCLNITGTANRGYETKFLERALVSFLGRDRTHHMVIVGAGNLGRALALHEEFPRQGFSVCGIFDASKRVVGRKVGKLAVQSMDELPRVVRRKKAKIGVIAVPSRAAQEVANQLAQAGVTCLLNMACSHVRTDERVSVVEAHLFGSLSVLSHAIKGQRKR